MCQKYTHTHTHKGKPDSQNLLELSHPLEVISQQPVECDDIRAENICGQVNEPMKGRMKLTSQQTSARSICDACNLQNICD
jgi:hypothetical protein